MSAALVPVQAWGVASAGYGWLVGAASAGFALLAWAAGGQGSDVAAVLLLVAAGLSLVAVVGSMLVRGKRLATLRFSAEILAALAGAGAVGVLGWESLDPGWMGVLRALSGAAFLGVVTDAMALGHWYLIDPKLPKFAIKRLDILAGVTLVADAILVLVPPVSIVSAFGGENSTLAIAWIASVALSAVLIVLVRRALNEPGYASVMSATGLLYVTTMVAFAAVVLARVAIGA